MKNSIEAITTSYLPEIESTLRASIEHRHSITSETCLYQLSTGGKRLRSILPAFIFNEFSKEPNLSIPLGVSAEFFHNSTLVHDDIIDGDDYRRNKETVWKKFGIEAAIHCGNSLSAFGFKSLLTLTADEQQLIKILKLASNTLIQINEGQMKEFEMKNNLESFQWDDYLQIAKYKTSSLFVYSVISSLLALNRDQRFIQTMQLACEQIGILFQMHDDWIDLFDDKGRKEPFADLKEGKPSMLISIFLKSANEQDRKALFNFIKKPRDLKLNSDFKFILELFNKYEIKTNALKIIKTQKESLLKTLESDPQARNLSLDIMEILKIPA